MIKDTGLLRRLEALASMLVRLQARLRFRYLALNTCHETYGFSQRRKKGRHCGLDPQSIAFVTIDSGSEAGMTEVQKVREKSCVEGHKKSLYTAFIGE